MPPRIQLIKAKLESGAVIFGERIARGEFLSGQDCVCDLAVIDEFFNLANLLCLHSVTALQGKIIARTDRRHTHREWLRCSMFLDGVSGQLSPGWNQLSNLSEGAHQQMNWINFPGRNYLLPVLAISVAYVSVEFAKLHQKDREQIRDWKFKQFQAMSYWHASWFQTRVTLLQSITKGWNDHAWTVAQPKPPEVTDADVQALIAGIIAADHDTRAGHLDTDRE